MASHGSHRSKGFTFTFLTTSVLKDIEIFLTKQSIQIWNIFLTPPKASGYVLTAASRLSMNTCDDMRRILKSITTKYTNLLSY